MLGRAGQETAEPRSRDLWPWAPDRGLIGLSSSEGGWSAPRVDPFVGFTGLNEPGALAPRKGAPLSARWRGEINAPRDGLFLVALRTDGEATLRLNGSPALAVCETRPVTEGKAIVSLAEGWQPIELDFHSDGRATTLELYWAEDGEVAQIVAPSALRFERQGGRVPAVAPPRRNTACPAP
jgi:hypothetical protein